MPSTCVAWSVANDESLCAVWGRVDNGARLYHQLHDEQQRSSTSSASSARRLTASLRDSWRCDRQGWYELAKVQDVGKRQRAQGGCEARDGTRCRAVKGTAQGAGSERQRTARGGGC
eukprot:6189368-Pleurochrysis_carterae.AAC.1